MKRIFIVLLLVFSDACLVFSQPAPPPPPDQAVPLDVAVTVMLVFAVFYALRKINNYNLKQGRVIDS